MLYFASIRSAKRNRFFQIPSTSIVCELEPSKRRFYPSKHACKVCQKSFCFFIDETLERRKGKKIKAKGFYRDAVRSSKSHVVNASGLKWLVMAISVRFPDGAVQFGMFDGQ